MNGGAPTCGTCGGLNTNPQSNQCRYCGHLLAPPMQAPPMQAPPMAHGYGPPPGGYGAPPQPFPQQPGYAPGPYGAPNPYPHVQPFQGGNGYVVRNSGWASGWSTFFWIRLAIAGIVILVSVMGACVSAIAGH